MQTYTHAAVGGVLGITLFPDKPLAQAVCIITSMVPDLVMVPQFIFDRLAGREALKVQSKRMMLMKEIGHSLVVWIVLGTIGIMVLPLALQPIGLAATLGGFFHGFVDVFTHGKGPQEQRPFWDTDLTSMWPLPVDLRPWGIWEYRHTPPDLVPKPPEVVVLLACAAFIAYQWLS